MNPLQTLYNNYTENTKPCYKYKHAFLELYRNNIDGEICSLLDELFEGVCDDNEKAFFAGFKTAVQLLMGGGQA